MLTICSLHIVGTCNVDSLMHSHIIPPLPQSRTASRRTCKSVVSRSGSSLLRRSLSHHSSLSSDSSKTQKTKTEEQEPAEVTRGTHSTDESQHIEQTEENRGQAGEKEQQSEVVEE